MRRRLTVLTRSFSKFLTHTLILMNRVQGESSALGFLPYPKGTSSPRNSLCSDMPARYSFLLVFLMAAVLSGCLSDPVTEPEIKPRLVLRPERAWLRATGLTTIEARWTHSVTDTQGNFKGYYLTIYQSAPYHNTSTEDS